MDDRGWREATIVDICDDIYDGPHATPKKIDKGPIFLSISSLVNGRIVLSESAHLSEEDFLKWTRRVTPQPEDLVFSYETRLGEAALIPEGLRCCLGRRMALIRPHRDKLDPQYFLYYFLSPILQNEIQKYMISGTTVERLALSDIRKFRVILPPVPEQKIIAHILKSLDDKIELNRQMNATLEGMAQALFKSWFVDFDPVIDNALAAGNPIPEELADRAEVRRAALADGTANREAAKPFPAGFQHTEELGWIPEGWEARTLEEATSVIIDHRGKTPKKMGSDWVESGYSAVSAKNIKDGKLVRPDTMRFVDADLYARWMSEELEAGDFLMTSEAPLGEKLYLAQECKWVLSQRLFGIRANETTSGIYLYHWLDTEVAKADIDGRASGTTVQGIRQSELRRVIVLTSDMECTRAFSESADSLMAKRARNELNSGELTKLRDTLLPKLISGELRIPDAEKLAEEALA